MLLQLDRRVELGERERAPSRAGPQRAPRSRLCAASATTRDVQLVDAEALDGRPRERDVTDVRRVEAAAEDPGYCHSSTSSPISTSWPLRAPAAFSTASSSSPCGASPTIRKPRSVR